VTQHSADNPTRVSLLIRLRDAGDSAAWEEFQSVYGPMLYQYCCARGLSAADADDVRSDCYEAVVRQMPTFEYDRARGGFKSWLRTIAVRRMIDRLKKRGEAQADSAILAQLSSDAETTDEIWEREWRQHHLRLCLDHARPQVNEQTWAIFESLLIGGASVDQVCSQMSVSANLVYKARTRVLELIRDHMNYLGAE
jgi:RNA polymerase sigma factor (sigma-70 family)